MQDERIKYLFGKYLEGSISEEEKVELSELALDSRNDDLIGELVADYWSQVSPPIEMGEQKADEIFQKIMSVTAPAPDTRKSALIRSFWFRTAAAAMIILMLGAGLYYFFHQKSISADPALVQHQQPAQADIAAPEVNRATLTIAEGRTIVLDTARNGSLTSSVNKVSAEALVYGETSSEPEWHTLTVPAGSRPMQLQLADGSKVWLNVGSSISFPTSFPGTERSVTVKGEAYFEVAHSAYKKFLVTTEKSTTEVLGTHFNVSSYSNDSATRITLLEGKVKVSGSDKESFKILAPGQQAHITGQKNPAIKVADGVNLEEVMAWKNGLFQFEQADIHAIMRQVERWYNVEVIFEDNISARFGGTIPRNVNISRLLSMLEMTGHVHFVVEGRKIIVKP